MKIGRLLFLMLFSALYGSVVPGSAPSAFAQSGGAKSSTVEERLQAIEKRLQEIERRLQITTQAGPPPALSPEASLEDRLERLDQQARIVESQRGLDPETASGGARGTPIVKAGADGFILSSADSSYRLKLGAHVQVDSRFFPQDPNQLSTNTFVLRSARPILEGTVARYFDFRFMPDFGNGTTTIQEAYVDARVRPQINIRYGKFKPPVGLERLKKESDQIFIERAQPTNMVPNRDLGVELYGDLWHGVLSYAAGAFNGVADGASGDIADHDGKDFAGRTFAHPFKFVNLVPLQGLGVGISGTFGDRQGTTAVPSLPFYRTSGQTTFFRYRSDGTPAGTVLASGTLYRYSPQAYYYFKSLGLLGEYVVSSQDVVLGSTTTTVRNNSWQVAGTYVLTGEKATYANVVPKRALDGTPNSWGAFEIAGRYTQLNIDKSAFPFFADPQASAQRAGAWALGLNWYLNTIVKFVLNYEQTDFRGGSSKGDRDKEKAILGRLQLSY